MKNLMCPKCGASTLSITEKGNYLCLMCNHVFNTETTKDTVKSITFEITKKKSLKFPKFESNITHSDCLIPDHSTLCCNDISCDECIFFLRNYMEFINSKESK